MLGFLLARRGVDVLVLEKHGDFLRDFRGDTLHPSTMEIMDELGLAEGLLRLNHTRAPRLRVRTPRGDATLAAFRRLKTRFPYITYITFIPQWDFLDFLTGEAKLYPDPRAEQSVGRFRPQPSTQPHSASTLGWISSGNGSCKRRYHDRNRDEQQPSNASGVRK
jgi:2-polyprenyl-6-methoxyphenol hydroxylase-like FAD-dependent oxidoreductase